MSGAEFKTLVIRMLEELSEDLSSIEKIQSEMKGTLIEIKNDLQGINRRVDEAKNQISDLEYKQAKKKSEQQEEKTIKKNEDSVRSLWNNVKHTSIHIMRGARRRERERNWKPI